MQDDFSQFVRSNTKSVYNFVFRILGRQDEAEDATQETFYKAWKNLKKLDASQNWRAWLFTIARRSALDIIRKRRNIPFSEIEGQAGEEDGFVEENIIDQELLPDEILERKDLAEETEKAIQKLRIGYREIIFLHLTEDFSFAEIAAILRKPLNTVKSQYRRALKELRRHIWK